MGFKDYHRVYPIYRAATDYSKAHGMPFHFKIDSGHYESGIVFNIEKPKYNRIPYPHETPDNVRFPLKMKVPDISCFDHKLLIEFEEETGPRKPGAKLADKGHGHEGDMDGKRDSIRNDLYEKAGFKLLRIWESDWFWKRKLHKFLEKCWEDMQ